MLGGAGERGVCGLSAGHAEFGAGIPIAGVEALIAAEPANATIHIYDAGHGFNSDRRDDYAPEAARLARDRTLALFRANGG